LTTYFYRSPILPRTLNEFQTPGLEIFPRERLARIIGVSLEEVKSKPTGTWYEIDGDRLLQSGQLE